MHYTWQQLHCSAIVRLTWFVTTCFHKHNIPPLDSIDADILVILSRHILAPRWNYSSVPRRSANHRRFGTESAARNLHASMILGWSTFPKCSLSRASGLFVDKIIIRVAHDNIMYPYPGGILLLLAVACFIACEFCETHGRPIITNIQFKCMMLPCTVHGHVGLL